MTATATTLSNGSTTIGPVRLYREELIRMSNLSAPGAIVAAGEYLPDALMPDEDFEYLKMLSDLGDRAMADREAQTLFPTAYQTEQSPDALTAARDRIAQRIVQLRGGSGGGGGGGCAARTARPRAGFARSSAPWRGRCSWQGGCMVQEHRAAHHPQQPAPKEAIHMNPRSLFSALVLIPLLAAPLALADQKEKKEPQKTEKQEKNLNISTSSGPRSCSATSGDKKQSCSVSCKDGEDAECSNTDTEATCACK